jgi:hypothetical protein
MQPQPYRLQHVTRHQHRRLDQLSRLPTQHHLGITLHQHQHLRNVYPDLVHTIDLDLQYLTSSEIGVAPTTDQDGLGNTAEENELLYYP